MLLQTNRSNFNFLAYILLTTVTMLLNATEKTFTFVHFRRWQLCAMHYRWRNSNAHTGASSLFTCNRKKQSDILKSLKNRRLEFFNNSKASGSFLLAFSSVCAPDDWNVEIGRRWRVVSDEIYSCPSTISIQVVTWNVTSLFEKLSSRTN